MRIFLDPGFENECTIWFDNGNIQTLIGNIEQNCIKIRNYVIDMYVIENCEINNNDEYGELTMQYQKVNIYLDIKGIGLAYANELDKLGVKYNKCTYNKII